MEVGAESITPGEGLVAKGLSGMASCGRRGRTFSTGKEYVSIIYHMQCMTCGKHFVTTLQI